MSTAPITVLSTKMLPQSLIAQAEQQHIHINAADFLKIERIRTPDVRVQIAAYAVRPITALFTSANAVAAVSKHLTTCPEWQIFCLSGKTKTTLLEHFSEEQIIASAPDAAALVPKIMAARPSGDCVFFCGNKHLNTLPEAFKAENIPLKEQVVYKTISSPQKINKSYDGLLFFSPSGVESFFELNAIAEQTVCFAIGDTTAKAVRKFTRNPVVIAGSPDNENMIQTVQNYFFKKITGHASGVSGK